MSDYQVELPIRYTETSTMGAAFAASARRLQALTPAPLRVVTMLPGRAPLAIIGFDYTQTSIGSYGEVAVTWPVVYDHRVPPLVPLLFEKRWPGLGWWVHRLPVTTEIANWGGRTLWGYPKFIADIQFAWRDATRVCTLSEGGQDILELSIDTRLPARPQRLELCTYSQLDRELLRTRIAVDAVGIRRLRPRGVTLRLGNHRVGREIAELGVDLARAIEVRWFPSWRALLPEAEWRGAVESPRVDRGAREQRGAGETPVGNRRRAS